MGVRLYNRIEVDLEIWIVRYRDIMCNLPLIICCFFKLTSMYVFVFAIYHHFKRWVLINKATKWLSWDSRIAATKLHSWWWRVYSALVLAPMSNGVLWTNTRTWIAESNRPFGNVFRLDETILWRLVMYLSLLNLFFDVVLHLSWGGVLLFIGCLCGRYFRLC